MNVTDMLVNAIFKRGVLYEAKNFTAEFEIPNSEIDADGKTISNEIKVTCKIENMSIKIDKQQEKQL